MALMEEPELGVPPLLCSPSVSETGSTPTLGQVRLLAGLGRVGVSPPVALPTTPAPDAPRGFSPGRADHGVAALLPPPLSPPDDSPSAPPQPNPSEVLRMLDASTLGLSGEVPPPLADSNSNTPVHGAMPCPPETPPPVKSIREAPDPTTERLLAIRAQRELHQNELLRLQQQEEDFLIRAAVEGGKSRSPPPPIRNVVDGLSFSDDDIPAQKTPVRTNGRDAAPVPAVVQPGQLVSPQIAMQMASMGNWGLSSVPVSALQSGGGAGPPPRACGDVAVSAAVEQSRGRIVSMARDQRGSQWLMHQLHEGSEGDIQLIFNELIEQMDLASDLSGSQTLAALFKCANELQRTIICERLASDLGLFAFNMHGTRLLQKVIELVQTRDQIECIMVAVACQLHSLIKDLNGNHIVQQCLQSFPPDVCQPVHDWVLGRTVELGTHRHGCCVLQRCIEYGNQTQQMTLIMDVINHGLHLVQDAFGNYLLQYILNLEIDFVNVRVIRQFLGSIATLSTNKFASNVVERCLKLAPDDVRQMMIDEIAEPGRLPGLLQDQYANYVVQTALSCANQQQFQQLAAEVAPLLHLIRNTPHGKRIESRLKQAGVTSYQSDRKYGYRARPGPPQGADSWSRSAPWSKSAEQDPARQWDSPQRTVTVLASGATLLGEPPAPQSSPPRVGTGFRLNANAVPFHASPPPPGPSAPANSPETLSPQRLLVPEQSAPKAVHPSLVFGAD